MVTVEGDRRHFYSFYYYAVKIGYCASFVDQTAIAQTLMEWKL